MSYMYIDNKFVDENGQVYQLNGLIDKGNLEFAYNDKGDLLYKDKTTGEIVFVVQADGQLYINKDYNVNITDEGQFVSIADWNLIVDTADTSMQKNIDLLRSHNKTIRIKATLLDDLYEKIESLVGRIKSINYNRTNSSLIRSTCSLTMSIPRKDQVNIDIENTWNKRMVKLECGILDRKNNEYVWYNLGCMLLLNGRSKFDATTQEVQLNLADLMASLAQERGSQIGTEILIPAGSNVRNALIEIIATYSDYKRYNICQFEDTIPYDLTISTGSYPLDMLQSILDLFPQYEMFYNPDGVFTVQPIPTKINDPIDIGTNVLDEALISESKSVDFADIKNTTEVWGRELSGDYTALECETVEDSYHITIDETFTELVSGETYVIVPTTNCVQGQKMKIQDTTEYGIYIEKMGTDENTGEITLVYVPVEADAMKADIPYVIKYFEQRFILQGELQIRCIVQEIVEEPSQAGKDHYMTENNCTNVKWVINPDSPYACTVSPTTGWIQGEMRQVLSDGEYSNIYTTQLAYERAEYENWLKCRMQDSIEIETILIPWMDINDKIQYTSPVSETVNTWLVQDIDYDFSNWTMTVKASRFYPYYPWN